MTEETTTTGIEDAAEDKGQDNQSEAFKRLEREKAELQKKLEEKEAKATEPQEPETDPEPGSAEYIQQVVKHEAKKEAAVTKFLSDFPEAKEYEGEIRKRLADPSRAKVPIDEVIRGALPLEAIMKMGAALREKELEDEKNQTMGGGDGKTKTKTSKAQEKAKKYMDSLPKGFRPE